MKIYQYLLIALFMLISTFMVNAQPEGYEHLVKNDNKLITDIRLYGGLNHQHEDFFNKAFSYQGIEAGTIINHHLILGLQGACFASNLKIDLENKPSYIQLYKTGLTVGYVGNDQKVLHTGWLVNAGSFTLLGRSADFPLFDSSASDVIIHGLVMSPEVFAEVNVTSWMKFRTGLVYSFYNFEDQSIINKNDLQNISVDFGFIFGNFR